jgi:hypothetical protein
LRDLNADQILQDVLGKVVVPGGDLKG